ncbi:MAG: thioredoxin-dependent thiol peroxidase [Bacteroidales bacterium]|nr:thioredoxin-dependent thiol peroxidase [Bacteroidales bacterium]
MANLNIGDQAPDFKLLNQDGESVSLSQYKGKKVIVYFYPKDDTPGCTSEACNFRDNYEYWQKQGYEVLGISPDNVASHKKFQDKYNLPFPLLSDVDKETIKAYGAWGLKKLYGREYEGLIRSTFLIDEDGKITETFMKVKTKEHTEQIIKKLIIN